MVYACKAVKEMLGKFLVVLTGLTTMSSTPVQGAAIGDNLTHDGAQAQGKDIQLELLPDPELALRRLRAFGAALFIVVTLGFCGTGLISSTIVSVRLMWLRTSATQ